MFLLAMLCLLTLVGVLVYPVLNHFIDPKSLRRFPAPAIAGITTLWSIWHNSRGRRFLAVHAAHEKLGSVVRVGPNSLSFSDPRAYKDIYGHGSSIIKDTFYDNLAGDTPSMADTSSRQLHALKRRNVSSVFSAKNVGAMEVKIQRSVNKLVTALQAKSVGKMLSPADRYPVLSEGRFDLRPWMNMFSFDAFSSMLWSSTYDFLERGDDDCASMDISGNVSKVRAMDCFQTGVHFNTLCAQLPPPVYKALRWLSQAMYRKQAADHFSGMARYQTVMRLKKGHPEDGLDFFSFFPLEVSEKRPCPMSVPELVAECTTFLNAGNDTTQITLTNIMYELASHPAQQQKLHDLLAANLPSASQPVASYSDLSEIPYLQACIDETLRLLPPVRFGLPRQTVEDGATITGHVIDAGVTVSSSVYTLHRDPSLFHRPLEWIPERWMVAVAPEEAPKDMLKGEAANLKDYVLPFTLGGRACIGRNLAFMEISICLAAMVLGFEWRISEADERAFGHFERFNSSPLSLVVSAKARPRVQLVVS